MATTLDDLRRFAAAHTLFPETTLARAVRELGYVQADPIRAPARAQDLILRHRVAGYRAGDLEKRYARLDVAEDFFVNYGFVSGALQRRMHPRPALATRRAREVLAFVRARGSAHPRDVDAHFAHGRVVNAWGGTSSATTHLLDALHYRGALKVARRDAGIRVYAAHDHPRDPIGAAERRARLDALVDVIVRLYAPLPAASLAYYVRRLRYAVPQWKGAIGAALARAKERLAHQRIDGAEWYWATSDDPRAAAPDERARFLAPFDPIVHDRARFEALWGWTYRFEAYTPVAKRKLGYYALPILFRDRVVGWANVAIEGGTLVTDVGFAAGSKPRDRAFSRELDAEIARMRAFLGVA